MCIHCTHLLGYRPNTLRRKEKTLFRYMYIATFSFSSKTPPLATLSHVLFLPFPAQYHPVASVFIRNGKFYLPSPGPEWARACHRAVSAASPLGAVTGVATGVRPASKCVHLDTTACVRLTKSSLSWHFYCLREEKLSFL